VLETFKKIFRINKPPVVDPVRQGFETAKTPEEIINFLRAHAEEVFRGGKKEIPMGELADRTEAFVTRFEKDIGDSLKEKEIDNVLRIAGFSRMRGFRKALAVTLARKK
jgi:hypothetical protein